ESFLTPLIESFPPPEFIILKKTIVGGSIFRQQRGSVYIQQRQLEMVRQRRISLVQASQQCELSYRQTLRIYQRYEEKGDAGLIHGNRGRVSSRKNPHQASII
ncbi:hypothetical protein ACKOUH_16110, partial [Legionella pneumophila]